MKLDDSRRSDNVEDDRGSGFGGRGTGVGIVGTLVILVAGYFLGFNPQTLLSILDGGPDAAPQTSTANDPQVDFARAYVIAHDVGHHVQSLLGISDSASRAEQRSDRIGANHVSIEVELQADCYAGVWAEQANQVHKILEPGDLEQGLQAASSVGDDTLQKRMQGTVVPDSFTHGTSAQRVRWFRRGFDSGRIENCDTFHAGSAL
jgi:predicted metalloprotease